jgi:hypothetical protein
MLYVAFTGIGNGKLELNGLTQWVGIKDAPAKPIPVLILGLQIDQVWFICDKMDTRGKQVPKCLFSQPYFRLLLKQYFVWNFV